jgi:hypothetical protein
VAYLVLGTCKYQQNFFMLICYIYAISLIPTPRTSIISIFRGNSEKQPLYQRLAAYKLTAAFFANIILLPIRFITVFLYFVPWQSGQWSVISIAITQNYRFILWLPYFYRNILFISPPNIFHILIMEKRVCDSEIGAKIWIKLMNIG